MKKPHELNTEYLRKVLRYDPASGQLVSTEQGVRVATSGEKQMVHLRKYKYKALAARVVYALMTGGWPKGAMRHRNGDLMDLRWGNLAMV